MSLYRELVLPRLVDASLGRQFDPIRARVAAGLTGTVLEVGFGSGRNVAQMPPSVSRVLAVEPSQGARRLAARRLAAGTTTVEFVGDDGHDLKIGDETIDCALITWSLCTIPDAPRALRELFRVLQPRGRLHFAEHGLSPNPPVAAWQRRVTPLWTHVAGGCHLDRPIDELIRGAGFEITALARYRFAWPEAFTYFYEGVAAKPG